VIAREEWWKETQETTRIEGQTKGTKENGGTKVKWYEEVYIEREEKWK
jgi:hypothetical protein